MKRFFFIAVILFACFLPLDAENAPRPACVLALFYDCPQPETEKIERSMKDVFLLHKLRFESLSISGKDKKKASSLLEKKLSDCKPDVLCVFGRNFGEDKVLEPLKDSSLPIVVAGFSWDFVKFSYPYKNMTGLVLRYFWGFGLNKLEPFIVRKNLPPSMIVPYNEDNIRDCKFYNDNIFDGKMQIRYVRDFAEFKQNFLDAQKNNSILLIASCSALPGWNYSDAERLADSETQIPSLSTDPAFAKISLLSLFSETEELGVYAAESSLKIIGGVKPSDMPMKSVRRIKFDVNMKLAKKLNLVLPFEFLKNGEKIW